jgi:hypothetical protein
MIRKASDGGGRRSNGMAKNESVHGDAEAALTEQLRAMFDTIAEQPVPDKLMDLVEALEEKRRSSDESADEL